MSDFSPREHLITLRGKGGASEYLEIKWRLVWVRSEHPDAVIETECLKHEKDSASFKATVTLPTGARATGHGQEERAHFPDFYEKSESKALGRALAALGYGTQFVGDELDEGERIVDSPVPLPKPTPRAPAPHEEAGGRGQEKEGPAGPPSRETVEEWRERVRNAHNGALGDLIDEARTPSRLDDVANEVRARVKAGVMPKQTGVDLAERSRSRREGLAALAGHRQDAAD